MHVVLDMQDRRPAWAMPGWVPERIREALPEGRLTVVEEATDGSGDGAARLPASAGVALEDATAYFGYGIAPEVVTVAERLEWVHSGAAGVGSSLSPELREADLIFTNSAGIHAPPMAETVLGMILHFRRGLDVAARHQREGRWSSDAFYTAEPPLAELGEAAVGLVGFGGIGREVARRVASLGARVLAVKRTPPRPGEADLEPVHGAGTLGERIELTHGRQGLERVLGESDVIVLAAPATAVTRGLVDREALALVRDGALLINVARGALVDEEAVLEALRSGRLRGAGLDVFQHEPLPEGHPLWSRPDVLITPHVSAVTTGFWRRELGLILRNLDRWLSGAPVSEWENVVDVRAGY